MRAVVLALALVACGDNKVPQQPTHDDAGVDSPVDAPPVKAGPCLDQPTDLPRPSTTLPCDLLPPSVMR